MGFDNLDDFVAYTSAGSGRVNARATRAVQLAKQTGHVQHFGFIVGNTFCSASMRLVAQTETRDAFLNLVTNVENAPQVTEHTLLSGVLESLGRKFFWKDTQRRFLGANQAFLDHYGFQSMADIIGKTDEDMGWHVDDEPYRGRRAAGAGGRPSTTHPASAGAAASCATSWPPSGRSSPTVRSWGWWASSRTWARTRGDARMDAARAA